MFLQIEAKSVELSSAGRGISLERVKSCLYVQRHAMSHI